MSEHRSVWLATAQIPRSSPLEGDVQADVVVVGGGIAGLTTAVELAEQGASVVVLEADTVGSGTTGHTTGKVTSQHGLTYRSLVERHGEDTAALYAAANEAGIARVLALAEEDAHPEVMSAYVYTMDQARVPEIEAELETAARLGLAAFTTTDVGLPFEVAAGLGFADQLQIHAGGYLAGLVRMLRSVGVAIHERSPVLDVDDGNYGVVARTDGGSVRADWAVITTLLPIVDIGGFFAKTQVSRSYGVAATVRSSAPIGMQISVDEHGRSTRAWNGGSGVIVVGESHPTGDDAATPERYGELERWAREVFPVDSFDYRWSSQDYSTADSLPYVGRSPRTDHVLVATGFAKWGLANATAAAGVLADLVAGSEPRWIGAFDATRIGGIETAKDVAGINAEVASSFVKGRISRLRAPDLDTLQPGEGKMVEVEGDAVGAYRHPDGRLDVVSITCTHLGCTLHWNRAETSWDCPCHGSRFGTDGTVLNGPATLPLMPVTVDD